MIKAQEHYFNYLDEIKATEKEIANLHQRLEELSEQANNHREAAYRALYPQLLSKLPSSFSVKKYGKMALFELATLDEHVIQAMKDNDWRNLPDTDNWNIYGYKLTNDGFRVKNGKLCLIDTFEYLQNL